MNPLEAITKAFTSAFDAIINTELYYRANRLSVLQAGMVLILPQMAAFLIEYNKTMGVKLNVKTDGYPLLLFVLLVVMFYELLEPRIRTKKASEVFRLSFLSIHVFAFALSLNLIYAVILQIIGQPDWLMTQASNAGSLIGANVSKQVLAAAYGVPFLACSIAFITWNSFRRHKKRMRLLLRAPVFWRTFVITVVLALYQYMAFILVDKTA